MENFTELSRGVRGPELPVLVEPREADILQTPLECTYKDTEVLVKGTGDHVSDCSRLHFERVRRQDMFGLCRYGLRWLLFLLSIVLATFYGGDLAELLELLLLI